MLPGPLVRSALARPITDRLLVTDAGYFPHAAAHGLARRNGARESIVIVCTRGVGWLTMAGRTLRVAAGDAVVIPAETPNEYRSDVADPWSIWWLHVTGDDAPALVEVITNAGVEPMIALRDVYSAVASIERAVVALERDETAASLYSAAGAAWSLLAQLAADRLQGPAATADRIQIVKDYLRDNLASPVSVGELARLASLSPSHFSSLFKTSTGIGVVEYVRRLRSARARELLITTSATIAEIGSSIGYSDPFYFSRQFRLVNGTSPSDFRRTAHLNQLDGPAVEL
ncbi:MAG: transcriptional regulator, AraC family [Glaciihabitans sp.]|nr:transcriptional regulator, AraC family [Glaciihabitans sp.]